MKDYIKNLIYAILIAIVILPAGLYAQNCGPTRTKFKFNTDSIYLSANNTRFKQQKFMLGWHWGAAKKLSEALMCNQAHVDLQYFKRDKNVLLKDSLMLILQEGSLTTRSNEITHLFQDQGMQYEPTNLISSDSMVRTDVPTFNPYDSTHTVFGFRTFGRNLYDQFFIKDADGNIIDSTDDYKQGLLVLRPDSAANSSVPVLSNSWPDCGFYYDANLKSTKNEDSLSLDDSLFSYNYNGTRWYFQINLRLLNDNGISDNTPLLKIKLPLVTHNNNSGYIKFYSVPVDTSGIGNCNYILCNTDSSEQRRGKYLKTVDAGNNTTEIVLTRQMFPDTANFVTIEAEFRCDGDTSNPSNALRGNQYLGWSGGFINEGNEQRIRSIGIEVYYYDKATIAIDWMRICTPETRKLMFGLHDNAIVSAVKNLLDSINNSPALKTLQERNIKPFRFYLRDEPSIFNAIGFKYFNDLVGNISTTAQGPSYPRIFAEYINAPELWIEQDKFSEKVSAPYFSTDYDIDNINEYEDTDYNSNRRKTMNLQNPRNKMCQSFATTYSDITHSEYETSTCGGLNSNVSPAIPSIDDIKAMTDDDYKKFIECRWSTLGKWELTTNKLGRGLMQGNLQRCGAAFLFDKRPWWGEVFVGSIYHLLSKNSNDDMVAMCTNMRPKTGEEIRLATGLWTILGAKGLLYDKDAMNGNQFAAGLTYDSLALDSLRGDSTWNNLIALNDRDFIYSTQAGSDFINGDFIYKQDYLDTNTNADSVISTAMNVDEDRIYIGMRSPRVEIYKLHKAIRRLEYDHETNPEKYPDDLMNLRLLAWHAKGFKAWDAPRTEEGFGYSGAEILRKYIDIDSIKTSRLYNISINNNYSPNYTKARASTNSVEWEAGGTQDSSFYDLTLLSPTDSYKNTLFPDMPLKAIDYYIGIQNRRTDPLIKLPNNSIHFYSSAELEDSCKTGSDTSYYKDLWWKRFGTRVIRIPMRLLGNLAYKPGTPYLPIAFFKVEEILSQDYTFNNENWWRDTAYCHLPKYYFSFDESQLECRNIDVKMLPGEAKILKCSYTPPCYFRICPGNILLFVKLRNMVAIGNNKIRTSLYIANYTDSLLQNLPILVSDSLHDISINNTLRSSLYNKPGITDPALIVVDSVPSHSEIEFASIEMPISDIDYISIKPMVFSDDGLCNLDSVDKYNNEVSAINAENIDIYITESGEYSYKIINSSGNVVCSQANKAFSSGLNAINFIASDYPDGEYTLIITKQNSDSTSNYFTIKNHKGQIK